MNAVVQLAAAAQKLPPQALEAEQSLLGALLLDDKRWDEVVEEVDAGDFYHKNHQVIFDSIRKLQIANEPCDIVTVSELLEREDKLKQVGELAYLSSLANNTPGTINIVAYAKIVRERALLRALIAAANKISETAYAPQERAPRKVLDYAEKLIFDISERDARAQKGFVKMSKLTADAIDRIEELHESNNPITGMPTGFADLDGLTSGLQRGDLVIVAGRPSMGKTAFALNIAEYVAVSQKLPVAVFSMEMPGEQLAMRMLSSMGRINSNKLRTGQFGDEEWPRITSAVKMLDGAPIFIDDSGGLTPLELRSRTRKLISENKEIGLIIVDYLQLMESSERNENRATEVSAITRSLKMLARELNVPIIALSQLNRGLEQRPNKRPILSDLRESGAIEQDADIVLFIYRDEVYQNQNGENEGEYGNNSGEQTDRPKNTKGLAEIIIGKQRNGPIGTVNLTFLGEFTRFEDKAADRFDEYAGGYTEPDMDYPV